MKKKKSRVGPIVCILGGALLLAPMVYATVFNIPVLSVNPHGTGGQNVNFLFDISGLVENNHNIEIELTCDPGMVRFWGRVNTPLSLWLPNPYGYPSYVVWETPVDSASENIPPGATAKWRVGPFQPSLTLNLWTDYRWEWEEINLSTSCGDSKTVSAGYSTWYYCR